MLAEIIHLQYFAEEIECIADLRVRKSHETIYNADEFDDDEDDNDFELIKMLGSTSWVWWQSYETFIYTEINAIEIDVAVIEAKWSITIYNEPETDHERRYS